MVISYFLYLFVSVQNKIAIVVIFKIGYLLVGVAVVVAGRISFLVPNILKLVALVIAINQIVYGYHRGHTGFVAVSLQGEQVAVAVIAVAGAVGVGARNNRTGNLIICRGNPV